MDLEPWTRAMTAGDFATAARLADDGGEPTYLVLALSALGRQHDAASRDAAAEAAFARAIATADPAFASDDPRLLRAAARLDANVYLARKNRYPEALACIRDALALTERARGDDHPDAGDILVTLGYRLLEGQAHFASALEQAEASLTRAIALLEPHPERATRLATARGYLAAVQRNRELAVVRDLRRILAGLRITVVFSGNTATLTGRVASGEERVSAARLAAEHPAVKIVINQLET